ncbi:hypothetical protein HanPI659440_Chr14g0566741 [Helianthus annuus]|nr:hypothetical protein HanPI659440_Chr14g0566741 [Helianthus annuus]
MKTAPDRRFCEKFLFPFELLYMKTRIRDRFVRNFVSVRIAVYENTNTRPILLLPKACS